MLRLCVSLLMGSNVLTADATVMKVYLGVRRRNVPLVTTENLMEVDRKTSVRGLLGLVLVSFNRWERVMADAPVHDKRSC